MIELSGTFNKLNQLLSLYGKQDGLMNIKQLGTIDTYYLNAIEQSNNWTCFKIAESINAKYELPFEKINHIRISGKKGRYDR